MSKIYYVRHGERYECQKIENDEDKRLIIITEEPLDGVILIDGKEKCSLSGGVGMFDEGKIKDGLHRPKLISGSAVYELEGFHIGTGITTLIKSEEYIRGLYLEIKELVKTLERLSSKISVLEEKIAGKPIF